MKQGPMPTVEYEGCQYKLLSRKTAVPDLQAMTSLEAHLWLIRNTRATGYSKAPAERLYLGGLDIQAR